MRTVVSCPARAGRAQLNILVCGKMFFIGAGAAAAVRAGNCLAGQGPAPDAVTCAISRRDEDMKVLQDWVIAVKEVMAGERGTRRGRETRNRGAGRP